MPTESKSGELSSALYGSQPVKAERFGPLQTRVQNVASEMIYTVPPLNRCKNASGAGVPSARYIYLYRNSLIDYINCKWTNYLLLLKHDDF